MPVYKASLLFKWQTDGLTLGSWYLKLSWSAIERKINSWTEFEANIATWEVFT